MRFLIIDDNPSDRELVIRRLRKEPEFSNSEYFEVGRPREFEEKVEDDGFDFVLTDYQLHWINGLQVLEIVRKRYPDMPVIMVTGTGSEEIAVEGLRAGLNNYILKKHLDRLPLAIHEALEKQRLRVQYEEAIQQLRASEERYREMFEQALTGVFLVTPRGNLLTCNPAFAHIFGFSSTHDASQANFATLYPTQQEFDSFVKRVEHEKHLDYYDAEMRRYDGTPVFVVENVVGTFNDTGALTQINGYLFDNTEPRKLAQQLQQAQKLESIGLLVSGIAHDFNNMLGGIRGYAERGLVRVSESHPLHENFARIQDIATRASQMTQQLLAFSRRQVLEPASLDLNVVIRNLLELLGKVLADQAEIHFLPDPNLKTVHADYAQMEQVLMNLCINARDAMPHGGKLTITTQTVDAEEIRRAGRKEVTAAEYVVLSVQDSGIGMSEQVRTHIFEPFFTTKAVGKGTGLGLAMVHGIIGQHDGFIDVESTPGHGTTFKLYLPAFDDAPEDLPLNRSTRDKNRQNGHDHAERKTGKTLMVVEDDPDLRYLMQEALEDYGYTVMAACDGMEGLNLFERHQNDIALIISDLITPKMAGRELYERIHEMRQETRFLFVSGYQANQISQNFVLTKGFEFLQKPFDLDELAAKVREMLP